jgi:ABC-2 type transport system ATP-binding protein
MNTEVPAVAVQNITVRYGSRNACEDVSFEVPQGSVYALLGRNGAGKSSLIRCLLGQQKPQSGEAFLFGHNVWNCRSRAMRKVGVVPEEPDAPPEMTASQLAAFCSRLYPAWDHDSFAARLARFGIPQNQAFRSLSKGQKGMLLFALALAPHPDLLVLDDPTLGLDAVARKATFEDLVGDLADRATTVLITTHDMPAIEGIADRVGILKHGRLLLDASMEELKARYRRLRYQRRNGTGDGGRPAGPEIFAATRVKQTELCVEAVITDYAESKFAAFLRLEGISDAEVSPMSLEEILIEVSGEDTGVAS